MTKCRASRAEERNLRKEHRLCHADIRVGRNQILLRFANVGPAFEQFRGQSGRQLRRESLAPRPALGGFDAQGHSPGNIVWILSQEDIDRVLSLADLPLEVWDLCIRNVENLPRLKHIKRRRDAMLKAQLGQLDRVFLGSHGFVGYLKLQIEIAEQEVIARHIADKGKDYGLLCVSRAKKLGSGGFGFPAISTE